MKKINMYLILLAGLSGVVVSSIITAMVMLTNARTPLEQYMSVAMAIVMQVSAYIFYYLWKKQKGYRILASVGIAVSIFGTICFSINQSNSIRNDQMIESNSFLAAQEAKRLMEDNRTVNKSLLDEKKKDSSSIKIEKDARTSDAKALSESKINELKELYGSNIKSLEQQKDSLPKNYTTRRNEISQSIVSQKKELAQKIITQNNELAEKIENENRNFDKVAEQNRSDVNALLESVTLEKEPKNRVSELAEKKADRGYVGFSETVNNWDIAGTELISLIIAMLLAFAFEYLSMGLFSYCLTIFQMKKEVKPSPPPVNKMPIPKNTEKETNRFEGIKLVHPQKPKLVPTMQDEKKKLYMKSMYRTAVNNVCIGYLKIAIDAGLSPSDGRRVFETLKSDGIIRVIDGETVILKGAKDESISSVS